MGDQKHQVSEPFLDFLLSTPSSPLPPPSLSSSSSNPPHFSPSEQEEDQKTFEPFHLDTTINEDSSTTDPLLSFLDKLEDEKPFQPIADEKNIDCGSSDLNHIMWLRWYIVCIFLRYGFSTNDGTMSIIFSSLNRRVYICLPWIASLIHMSQILRNELNLPSISLDLATRSEYYRIFPHIYNTFMYFCGENAKHMVQIQKFITFKHRGESVNLNTIFSLHPFKPTHYKSYGVYCRLLGLQENTSNFLSMDRDDFMKMINNMSKTIVSFFLNDRQYTRLASFHPVRSILLSTNHINLPTLIRYLQEKKIDLSCDQATSLYSCNCSYCHSFSSFNGGPLTYFYHEYHTDKTLPFLSPFPLLTLTIPMINETMLFIHSYINSILLELTLHPDSPSDMRAAVMAVGAYSNNPMIKDYPRSEEQLLQLNMDVQLGEFGQKTTRRFFPSHTLDKRTPNLYRFGDGDVILRARHRFIFQHLSKAFETECLMVKQQPILNASSLLKQLSEL